MIHYLFLKVGSIGVIDNIYGNYIQSIVAGYTSSLQRLRDGILVDDTAPCPYCVLNGFKDCYKRCHTKCLSIIDGLFF